MPGEAQVSVGEIKNARHVVLDALQENNIPPHIGNFAILSIGADIIRKMGADGWDKIRQALDVYDVARRGVALQAQQEGN